MMLSPAWSSTMKRRKVSNASVAGISMLDELRPPPYKQLIICSDWQTLLGSCCVCPYIWASHFATTAWHSSVDRQPFLSVSKRWNWSRSWSKKLDGMSGRPMSLMICSGLVVPMSSDESHALPDVDSTAVRTERVRGASPALSATCDGGDQTHRVSSCSLVGWRMRSPRDRAQVERVSSASGSREARLLAVRHGALMSPRSPSAGRTCWMTDSPLSLPSRPNSSDFSCWS
mmetsp:Transcript_453/g.1480  ORF Transcript_453/g.1480 Transcript_453/m.1480 type:complete len:230 (+) Transcript_453:1514-2203(+)